MHVNIIGYIVYNNWCLILLISINDGVNIILFLTSYFKQLQPSEIPQVESATQYIDTTRLHMQDSCIFLYIRYSTLIAAEPQRGSTLFLTCSLDPVFCAELCIVEKSIRVGWMLDVHFPGEKVEFQVIF